MDKKIKVFIRLLAPVQQNTCSHSHTLSAPGHMLPPRRRQKNLEHLKNSLYYVFTKFKTR